MTDHMLVASFDPVSGWSAPEIKPYGPFTLDPASSCFQYATNTFEGMKVRSIEPCAFDNTKAHMNHRRMSDQMVRRGYSDLRRIWRVWRGQLRGLLCRYVAEGVRSRWLETEAKSAI